MIMIQPYLKKIRPKTNQVKKVFVQNAQTDFYFASFYGGLKSALPKFWKSFVNSLK